MQHRYICAVYIGIRKLVERLVYNLDFRIGKEHRRMKCRPLQAQLRRFDQGNGPHLLAVTLLAEEVGITHCSNCLPTAPINNIHLVLQQEVFRQFAKSQLEFCLVHFAERIQVSNHLRLRIQEADTPVQRFMQFGERRFEQFLKTVRQLPDLVERDRLHIFQHIRVDRIVLCKVHYIHKVIYFPVIVSEIHPVACACFQFRSATSLPVLA